MPSAHRHTLSLGTLLAAFLICLAPAARAEATWITRADLPANTPVVLHFRHALTLAAKPVAFPVRISADNRFILYVNGRRVAQGPARGDLAHWRYERVDLAPYLSPGNNIVAAEVWNAVTDSPDLNQRTSPFAQLSARTGFWLEGETPAAAALDSGPAWSVAIQPGHSFTFPLADLTARLGGTWYAAGTAETIDGAALDPAWNALPKTPAETAADWTNAIPALSPAEPGPWHLVEDPLPPMRYDPVQPGPVVRTDFTPAAKFPARSVVIPPNSDIHILLDQHQIQAAYPALTVSGGKGARITVTYAEALYDDNRAKGDRNEVANRRAIGLEDTFLPDGRPATFRPLWWRAWRYLQLTVKTGADPLTLQGLSLHATGYPYEQKARFTSSDPQLDRIWNIGWHTVQFDSHETFMDSAYWEQLQYVGDTRIDADIVAAVSGDMRLVRQAIDAFGDSQGPDGMIQSAYPSSTDNVIPPFGLLWIGMLHDYWRYQPDTGILVANLPKARRVLDWYAPYVAANGLLTRNPQWNFVDWVGDPGLAREVFPSFDPATGTSCLTSLLYLGALQQAADLEQALGDPARATDDAARATTLAAAIQANCWDAQRGLYADDPSHTVFSQHTNALAVLYDVAPRDHMQAILDKVTVAKGIDAPAGILETSYYFSWYLIHACDHAGLGDRYLRLLDTWRGLEAQHYTTWPEARGHTRSDSHAWTAHPTADLLGIVAGIAPASPGYATVRITPHPGDLKTFDAAAQTPHGQVRVRYTTRNNRVRLVIDLPPGLPGDLVWSGRTYTLRPGANTFNLT